jgi:hypothetical protein
MWKMPPRTIRATRYVTPLREGGSLPAIVEADDDGLYVLKFRGAGQGPLALVAELIAGEIGRALGLPVPELVFVELDEAIGKNEEDPEIQDLLLASVGLNLALDYLPGSVMFDRAAGDRPDPALASRVVWFDAFVMNVDRTARNPNLLRWHDQFYLIDHGASLYFQHQWQTREQVAASSFPAIRNHLMLEWASRIREADEEFGSKLAPNFFRTLVAHIPDLWLAGEGADEVEPRRRGYADFLERRLAGSNVFVEEAERAYAGIV